MLIFHEMGKPSMVREVFKQARDVFRQQMDSDLSPETEALYETLLSETNQG